MRARTIILVLAILAVAGFAALNWAEFTTSTPLSFGIAVVEAPLGLILLTLLTIALVTFLVASAAQQTTVLVESRQHSKALAAQRDLAETAEASRFTDLRQHLDAQLRENRQRETIAAAEFEKSMVGAQRELRHQLELMNRTLAAQLGEIEGRIDARLAHLDAHPLPHREPVRL